MKKGPRIVFLALAVFVPAILSFGAQTDIMPVSQIKAGMEGTGLTVFEGTKPEEFKVKVIAVMPNSMPKQDMILVELSGHDLEKSGVIAGMSGSPIFIDGKIIGALAYAWSYSTKPIAGITPIENMLKDLAHPMEPENVARAAGPVTPVKTYAGDMVPVQSPLMVSGLAPSVMGELAEALEPYNLVPMRAGGGGMDEQSPDLVPGSAIGVSIVRGDIEMDAIGTVTYRKGDEIMAFGHPFLTGGQVSFPMNGARIFTVLPSLRISTKMGASLSEVGGIEQDRQSGIYGRMGRKVEMAPIDIKISNPATGYSDEFHMEMGWEPAFSLKILEPLLKSVLMAAEPALGENTLTVKMEIGFSGHPLITLKNTFFNNQGPYSPLILQTIQRLVFNPFEEVKLESLKLDMSVDRRIMLAVIDRLWMEEDAVKPGSTAHLHVVLKPFEGEEIDYPVEVEVPQDLRSGDKFLVGVAGGREVMPPVAPPVNFQGVVDLFSSAYSATDMVVIQQLSSVGAAADGFLMTDLPPSAIRILGPDNATGTSIRQDLKFTPISTKWVVLGTARLIVQVE